MNNFKQKRYVSKNGGRVYLFQFPGMRAAAQIVDRVSNKFGIPQEEKMADEMMRHIIIEPKLKWDSFGSDKKEFNEVMTAAYKFMEGEDEEEESHETIEEGSSGES